MNNVYVLRIKPLICFLLFILSSNVIAQDIAIRNIPLQDKLPVNAIHRIYQDSDGFMWYGTFDGLCRSDGYNIRVFRSDLYHPNLLTNNYITYIIEDHQKKIWFGTIQGGYILDKETYRITRINMQEMTDLSVFSINVTKDGTVWVSVSGGLFHYQSDGTLLKRYTINYNNHPECLYFVYEDNHDNLLISATQNGMYKLDKEKDEFQPYYHQKDYMDIERIIWDDKHQCYWLGTWGKGIVRFTPDNSQKDPYTPQPIPIDITGNPTANTYHMVQDDTFNYLWVTAWNDLYVFKITEDCSLQQIDTSSFLNPSNKILYEIYKDKEGKLWVSAFDIESFIIDIQEKTTKNYSFQILADRTQAVPAIASLYKDDDDVFWFAQERYGLCIFDAKSNKLVHFSDCKDIQHLPFGDTPYIFKSKENKKIWIVPQNRVLVYGLSRQGMNIRLKTKISLDDVSLNPGYINTIFEDTNNNLWIGSTTGLFVYQLSNATLTTIPQIDGYVSGITQTMDGKIWITLKGKGICCIDLEKKVEFYSIIKNFTCISSMTDGQLFTGTSEGEIISYAPDSKELIDYSQMCGMNGDFISNVVADNYNHIWIVTNHMLKEFNPRNGAYRTYKTNSPNSLIRRYFEKAVYYDNKKGIIYLGGIGGAMSFPTSQQLESIPQQVKTYITDIKIMGKSILAKSGNNFPKNSVVKMKSDEQNLQIEFSSLDFHSLEQIRYAYRLIGVDKDWVYLNEGQNYAFYNKLHKGKYTFEVKATDKNGLWSNKITMMTIDRLPAYYETWWAYTIYILIIVSIIYLIFQSYKQRLKQENDQKLAEQIIQIKLRYFTNISHDLLTPLTILSCISDEMEQSEKADKKNIKLMQANIQRLKRLLQQILDFHKIENNKMRLYVSYGDLLYFTRSICENSFTLPMEKKNIHFVFNTNANKIEGYFDQNKLDKILFNILSNALKYTPAGKSIEVNINTFNLDLHRYVKIKIKDEGKGIAPNELDKIFTRFYINKSNDNYSSNGIGLSLTKELVELHHGRIEVQSQLGKGSEFSVEFPIDKESYSSDEFKEMYIDNNLKDDALSNTVRQTQFEDKHEYNLLLIEDNEELLHIMKDIFCQFYNVVAMSNGREALNYIKENNIDIIISDIIMPEMNGLELCQQVKNDISTSHIIIILLTADTNIQTQIDSYKMGADAYVAKPFKTATLKAQIESLLKKRELIQSEITNNPIKASISDSTFTAIDQQFIEKAVEIVENHLSDINLNVNMLAEQLNMSRSTFMRKIKAITGKPALDFIRNIKMQHARQMLNNKTATISDVIVALGYNDHKNFTNTFKKTFGITPSEYIRQCSSEKQDTNNEQ